MLFTVTAEEKFEVKTVYRNVEANSEAEAVELCKGGSQEYSVCENLEGGEEWLETIEVALEETTEA
jgi:hypothetical protein